MSREQFARFKNQVLGGTVLRDGRVFAEILGDMDFEFWRNIHETEPYLRTATPIRLDNVTKGRIILERLDAEPSPKRFAEMLKAIYEALSWYSATPKNLGDSMWQTYVHRLQAEREATGFTDLNITWVKEPEAAYTQEFPQERYWLPGLLEISYTGEDWEVERSQELLTGGFTSEILKQANSSPTANASSQKSNSSDDRAWYEKPFGLILIAVVAGLIVAGTAFYLGWQ
jgi:hypothetical protein